MTMEEAVREIIAELIWKPVNNSDSYNDKKARENEAVAALMRLMEPPQENRRTIFGVPAIITRNIPDYIVMVNDAKGIHITNLDTDRHYLCTYEQWQGVLDRTIKELLLEFKLPDEARIGDASDQ